MIGGVRIPAGAEVLVSPYITQRMARFWDRPEVFDPERFAPERDRRQHRYAHFPFGGGPHLCLGQHLFYLEAQLIVATLLSRFRFRLRSAGPPPATDVRPPEATPPPPPQPSGLPAPADVAAPPADAKKTPSGLASKVLARARARTTRAPTNA